MEYLLLGLGTKESLQSSWFCSLLTGIVEPEKDTNLVSSQHKRHFVIATATVVPLTYHLLVLMHQQCWIQAYQN